MGSNHFFDDFQKFGFFQCTLGKLSSPVLCGQVRVKLSRPYLVTSLSGESTLNFDHPLPFCGKTKEFAKVSKSLLKENQFLFPDEVFQEKKLFFYLT